MLQSLGSRLRQRREEQGIDLIAIAAQTKIKTSLLEALERDDVSQWPCGIFRRAYIRAYAQAIGLQPDSVVREFLEAFPEPEEIVTTEAIAAAVENGRPGGPPTRLRYIVNSAIGSLSRFRRAPAGDAPPVKEHPADRPIVEVKGFVQLTPSAETLVEAAHDFSNGSQLAEEAVHGQPAESAQDTPFMHIGPGIVDQIQEGDPADRITVEERPRDASDSYGLGGSAEPRAGDDELAACIAADQSIPRAEEPERAASFVEPAPQSVDFGEVAQLCTDLARAESSEDVQRFLARAATTLDAPGIVLWLWDPIEGGLRPVLAHGYSDRVLAQLPTVAVEADNATAAAFRSQHACATAGTRHTNAALVVPLLTSAGSGGVLAFELSPGMEQDPSARAAATILAALLSQLLGDAFQDSATAGQDQLDQEDPSLEDGSLLTVARH